MKRAVQGSAPSTNGRCPLVERRRENFRARSSLEWPDEEIDVVVDEEVPVREFSGQRECLTDRRACPLSPFLTVCVDGSCVARFVQMTLLGAQAKCCRQFSPPTNCCLPFGSRSGHFFVAIYSPRNQIYCRYPKQNRFQFDVGFFAAKKLDGHSCCSESSSGARKTIHLLFFPNKCKFDFFRN